MNYRDQRNYENLTKRIYPGVGAYDIPQLEPVQFGREACEFIPFSAAARCKDRAGKGVHFFIDDYRFTRLWSAPDNYMPMLQEFKYVMTPDFSMYTDYPKGIQIYNHYRKHWIGAYLQEYGVQVIPTICWSDESSYEWCFDGEPEHSVVNGAKTAPVTATMKRADEKSHAAYRKEMDTFLDGAYARDKTFVQGSRNARKANRANKRSRRG